MSLLERTVGSKRGPCRAETQDFTTGRGGETVGTQVCFLCTTVPGAAVGGRLQPDAAHPAALVVCGEGVLQVPLQTRMVSGSLSPSPASPRTTIWKPPPPREGLSRWSGRALCLRLHCPSSKMGATRRPSKQYKKVPGAGRPGRIPTYSLPSWSDV